MEMSKDYRRILAEVAECLALLKDQLESDLARNEEAESDWKDFLDDLPYCELEELIPRDIGRRVIIKGKINLWYQYPTLIGVQEDLEDEEFETDSFALFKPELEAIQQLTGRFYLKSGNRATFYYPPQENLPPFRSTWSKVIFEMIDYLRRNASPVPDLAEEINAVIDWHKN